MGRVMVTGATHSTGALDFGWTCFTVRFRVTSEGEVWGELDWRLPVLSCHLLLHKYRVDHNCGSC